MFRLTCIDLDNGEFALYINNHYLGSEDGIPSAEVDPTLRAFGRLIAHCLKKKRRIHIPAMCGSDWGHVLRTLELKRAFN